MGSDPIALPLLEWLAAEGEANVRITHIYTQPDRPVGRGQRVVANAIKQWALARGLPVRQPEKLTAVSAVELAADGADVALVMAYGHILKPAFIDTPRLGTLNLHTSILPRYRGASPIQSAVARGDRETGVSLMRIVPELDAGPVADVERVAIAPHDTAMAVEAKLAQATVAVVARNLGRLRDGTLEFVEQDPAEATFCRRLTKDDGGLDLTAPAAVLAARINGLFPWPSCRIELAGEVVKLGLAEATEGTISAAPGTVLEADERLVIATGQGGLNLLRLQRPGGRMLPAADFLRGFSVPVGTTVASAPMPDLVRT